MRWARSAALLTIACTGCTLFYPVPGTGAGCQGEAAGYYPALDVVRLRAADELDCSPAAVGVVAQSDTTFRASGCGRSTTYTCESDAVSGCSLEEAAERESCQAAWETPGE